MNIVLGPISSPKSEPSLLHTKTSKDSPLLAFYINDIFEAFKTYQKQYISLRNYFFVRII